MVAEFKPSSNSNFQKRFLYPLIVTIFFASGFAALIYQIAWQRALFTIFGINVEAVTVVVTGFLIGLGFGSLIGGRLSRTRIFHLLTMFGMIELSIGMFGLVSLSVFHWVGTHTLHFSVVATTAVTLIVVILPTLLMGATLPILTQYFVRRARNVGRSVGLLYCINTLGSAIACFVCAFWLLGSYGLQATVIVAAGVNIFVGICGLVLARLERGVTAPSDIAINLAPSPNPALAAQQRRAFGFAFLIAVLTGYVSLSYEVVWFRAYLIGTNQVQAFALILGAFLAGIACGSCWVRRHFIASVPDSQLFSLLCFLILGSSVLGFSTLPIAAWAAEWGTWSPFFFSMLALVFIQTTIAGTAFPILCHIGFAANDRAGVYLSRMYVGNIIGSAAGTLITGFLLMEVMSTAQISVMLAVLGAVAAAAVSGVSEMSWSRRAVFILGALMMIAASPYAIDGFFDHYYERITYKNEFRNQAQFVDVVENKSGVITVDSHGIVYGGGMYDGLISIDLVDDHNLLVRPISLSLYHAHPRDVLMIGLATGAWAQVVAANPDVERLTIVEINPGYLSLIRKYPIVAPLLDNPKVKIIIDDGRRWLNRHPDRKFDAIVQNTTIHHRPNATNLLSAEYISLTASHLREGGVLMYNTTRAPRAELTACLQFPNAVREFSLMVISNEPLQMNLQRLRDELESYAIDGNKVFDLTKPKHRARLNEIMTDLDYSVQSRRDWHMATMESCESIKARTKGLEPMTDDNMGVEWELLSLGDVYRRTIHAIETIW